MDFLKMLRKKTQIRKSEWIEKSLFSHCNFIWNPINE